MNKLKFLSTVIFASLFFVSCSNDDDTPEVVNEEEVITTLTTTLTPDASGTPIVLRKRDLDGDGPNAPVFTVSGNLVANTTYKGTTVLQNETVTPAEDVTIEVKEENTDHQFFYISSSNLGITTEYEDLDEDGNPLGTEFTLKSGAASAGTLTVVLRHEPKKPNDGSLADAAGETDFTATFSVTVE